MAGLVLSRKERKELRKQEAIERNTAYQEQISTPRGIRDYMQHPTRSLGTKQMENLEDKLMQMENQLKKKK
tara:strand:- start:878 stop:1090 length:213 start_codon:yes stop_codon:yes gene_type:complete